VAAKRNVTSTRYHSSRGQTPVPSIGSRKKDAVARKTDTKDCKQDKKKLFKLTSSSSSSEDGFHLGRNNGARGGAKGSRSSE
jgi:hypothetical protein